ncbi:MAG: hypothetical protein M1825_003794 [Sarcosagium campestre]|nr:MAG: hypothetical protein M1825_003794 [Sarcosagium campestre]
MHPRQRRIDVAKETNSVLPHLFKVPGVPLTEGRLCVASSFPKLEQADCPRYTTIPPSSSVSDSMPPRGTAIKVVNADTLDVALGMLSKTKATNEKPPVVLNHASPVRPGGAWLTGFAGQEEFLCYRSSLISTLKPDLYPMPEISTIYSPTVLVIRDSAANGHGLLLDSRLKDLPVVSCLSTAAREHPSERNGAYAKFGDRELMKEKCRLLLRVAAANEHRRLVLGALGCGGLGHPARGAAEVWKDVFRETEFKGGWWAEIVFAVYCHPSRSHNFDVFHKFLDGLVV